MIHPGAFQPLSESQTASRARQTYEKSITPSYGPLPNHQADIVFEADFLYWYSTIDNLPYAEISEVTSFSPTSPLLATVLLPIKIEEFDWKWHAGLRAGLGIVTNYDGWDVKADWTYFYNKGRNSISVPPFVQPSQLLQANPVGTRTLNSSWSYEPNSLQEAVLNQNESIEGDWSLLFNQIDLKLGRKFWISRRLTFKPFGGVRGHWSRLRMNSNLFYNGPFDDEVPATLGVLNQFIRMKQRFWAAGLLAGMSSAWQFVSHLSIFGEISASLIYGNYETQKKVSAILATDDFFHIIDFDVTQTYKHNMFALQPVFDLAIGIRWESTLANEFCRLSFDAGWEDHLWWNYNRFDRLSPLASSYGNLSLSGFVVRGQFEF